MRRSYLRYLRLAKKGPDIANDGGNVPVKLKLLDEQTRSRTRDAWISSTTPSTAPRAPSAAAPCSRTRTGTFTPGMFGRIQVASGPPGEALLVPDVAIGTEQVRKYVLVVDDQNVARAKYVTLGPVVDGLRVIASGLAPDDRVVVNGLMRVRPGVKVTPQLSTASASAGDQLRPN